MATKARNVEVLAPQIAVTEGVEPIQFVDVLSFMNGREYHLAGKQFTFTLLSDPTHDIIIEGYVVTTQDSDIPPKRNKNTGAFSAVQINPRIEGFAFANIFLYDTSRNVMVYEVNKNGCYPTQFIEAVQSNWNSLDGEEERTPFDLKLFPFVRLNEYNRMLQMSYYKKISVKLANPQGLVAKLREENDAIGSLLRCTAQNAFENNANSVRIEQVALSRKMNPHGLSHRVVKEIVDKVLAKCRGDIMQLEVHGYNEDAEDSRRCRPIDLLADTFNESFRIEDIQVHTNLQISERRVGVEGLYNKILPEIRQIIGR